MKRIHLTRRSFIKSTLVAGVAPSFAASKLFGADAPSDKITVGFIGVGSHGTNHNLRSYLKQPDAQVVMVCDVDGARMAEAKPLWARAPGGGDETGDDDAHRQPSL